MTETRVLLGLVALLALGGCATRPVPDSEMRPAPRDRIVSAQYLDPAPGTGSVLIKRDAGYMGSGCLAAISVDGQLIADLGTAETLTIYLRPGEHVLGAGPRRRGLCAMGNISETGVDVHAGASLRYRVSVDTGGIRISPTAY